MSVRSVVHSDLENPWIVVPDPQPSTPRTTIARLIALQLTLADGLRDAIDEVWDEGDAVLPLDPSLPRGAVEELVSRLRPAEFRRPARRQTDPTAPPVPDGTAVVVATNGSTGAPKGILIAQDTLDDAVDRQLRRLGAHAGQPWLGVVPMHHVAGILLLLRSRAAGVEPTLHDRDSRAAIDLAPPSWISLVPTQLDRLLDQGAELSRHLGVLLGGAKVEPHLLERARAADVAVTVGYGMTETCGGCVYDGLPLEGVETRVDDSGVLHIRGPVVADGKRVDGGRHEPLVDDAGWLETHDYAVASPDGRIDVDGRADDVVVSGGENVPLDPVRRALASLPFVEECAVVGLPDERWGTAVTAVVVPRAVDRPQLATLRDALRGVLRPTHLPTRLVVVDRLPRDRMGKVTADVVEARLNAERHVRASG